ncbi:MAG: EAL domain-containing protein [Bacteroidota bacterium]
MDNSKNYSVEKLLENKIKNLMTQLEKEKKISGALLKRVKTTLSNQANANEIFEHNALLVEEVKEARKQLYVQAETSQKFLYLARHDALTGLVNRDEFESRLKLAVKSSNVSKEEYALCFLDLDQFKVINDTAGHMAGDEMLKQLSTILVEHIRNTDTLARLGGDEFGLLFERCSLTQATKKIHNILELIEEFSFSWENKVFRVSASAGVAMINSNTKTYVDSLKHADIACFAAKNAGRNRYHVYEVRDEELTKQSYEMQWVPRILEALEHDRFRLFAQKIIPTSKSDDHVHYEVLIRLCDENNNILPPGSFLPTAERYGLIVKIDHWVIGNVFSWIEKNKNKLDPVSHFSINLSGQSLGDEKILEYISTLFKERCVSPSIIHFEVTETMAISNLKSANHFIKTIKDYGCSFSLDDFGSGLSSFGYLKNLAVDTLKIDGVFVRDIIDDPIDAAMVDSINTIGHVMGLKTIAEFVENDEIAEKLTEIGVDYLQGYGVGKPEPIDNILL